jgi:uncharacterized protein (TIGR03437 family)
MTLTGTAPPAAPPPPAPAPTGVSLALNKPASQSSIAYGGLPSRANDGNTDGNFYDGSVTHTNMDVSAWWQVDLGDSATVDSVVVWGRTDCCGDRLSDYWLFVSDTPFSPSDTWATLQVRPGTWNRHQVGIPSPSTSLSFGGLRGRYVRVQLTGTNNLSLAEVQVFGAGAPVGTNLAIGKVASQSSLAFGGLPSRANDGNTDGNYYDNSASHTNVEANAWWQVDLGASSTVNSVVLWGRTDCCGDRLSDYWVFLSDTSFGAADTPTSLQVRPGTWSVHQVGIPSPSTTIPFNGLRGRYVRVQLTGTNALTLAEAQVFGALAPVSSSLSLGKPASQSSLAYGGDPSRANDGNTDGGFYNGSVTHTNLDVNAWWQVDLGASATVNSVAVWGRTDCCGDRLSDYWVFLSDTPFGAADTPTTLQVRPGTRNSHQVGIPSPSTSINFGGLQGRYVRVQLTGANNLSLAEVQVFGAWAPILTNLSLGKPASQSSIAFGGLPNRANDGNTDGNYYDNSTSHTNLEANAWWQVDLGATSTVNSVAVWGRTDCCGDRLSDYWVFLSDTPFGAADTPTTLQVRPGTWNSHQVGIRSPGTSIPFGGLPGRYVRVQLTGANFFTLAEVQVWGSAGATQTSSVRQSTALRTLRTPAGVTDDTASASGLASNSSAASLRGIVCAPRSLTAGSHGLCQLNLDHIEDSTTADVQLSSSSDSVRLPDRVVTRPGQSIVEFQVDAVGSAAADGIVVAAQLGTDIVAEKLAIARDGSVPIHVPGRQFVKYGTQVRFPVSPSDPAATLSAGELPAGANFDAATGVFNWMPDGTQLGAHDITFTAVDATGAQATASVTVQVDSGEPVVTRIVNAASRSREAACSPGSIASIEGRWLNDGRVWINGVAASILSASATELSILCPDSVPGSVLEMVVQTDRGISGPVRTTARTAAPGIFSVDGSGDGQGSVLLEDRPSLAMVRNYRLAAQPAMAGDRVVVYATGIDRLTNISAKLGDRQMAPAAMGPVADRPGLFWVAIVIPDGVTRDNQSALLLTGDTTEGTRLSTNQVSIAVESIR